MDPATRLYSCDDHLDLPAVPPGLWQSRLPRAQAEQGPRVVTRNGKSVWMCEDRVMGISGTFLKSDALKKISAIGRAGIEDDGYRAGNPKLRLQDMDRDSLWASVIYGPLALGFPIRDPALQNACYAAWNDWAVQEFNAVAPDRLCVLAFLTDEEQVSFSNNLGEVIPMGPKRPDGTREVVYKITLDPRENPFGAEYLKATIGWHIDGLFDDGPPPKATMLSARCLSAMGGQTEFCSTYAAYEDLPEGDKRYCESLRLVHSLEASRRSTNPNPTPEDRASWREAEARRERAGRRAAKEHPLVWHHRSGRRSLVLGMNADRVVGMPEADSRALIEKLTAHATRRDNVYRHEWTIGDLLMWDNCGVMHRVTPYDPNSGRMMHRTTLYGVERIMDGERDH